MFIGDLIPLGDLDSIIPHITVDHLTEIRVRKSTQKSIVKQNNYGPDRGVKDFKGYNQCYFF